MPEGNGATELRIRGYLANHGGSVEDGGGRGLTDDMARELGVDKPAALSGVLQDMERDGVITREMRGLRTYKIALVDGADPVPVPVPAAAVSPPAGSRETVVSLRDAISRKTASPVPSPVPEPAPAAATGGQAVSLREALARPTAKVASPPTPTPTPAPAPTPGRTVSLRDAIAAGVDTDWAPSYEPPSYEPPSYEPPSWEAPSWEPQPYEPQPWEPQSGGQLTSLRRAAVGTPNGRDEDEATPKRGRASTSSGGRRSRSLLSVPVPEVKTPPSTTMITAVGVALAGLVLVAVITTVFARGSSQRIGNQGSLSTDACNVVTTAQATVAFGDDAGPANYVLGTCVYDDGTHELIVEVYRQDGSDLFNAAQSSSAVTVPNLGDAAYYDNGELRVLRGGAMLEVTLGPVPAATPAPSLVAAARLSVARLALPVVTG